MENTNPVASENVGFTMLVIMENSIIGFSREGYYQVLRPSSRLPENSEVSYAHASTAGEKAFG